MSIVKYEHLSINMELLVLYIKCECQTWNKKWKENFEVFRIVKLRQITIYMKIFMSNLSYHIEHMKQTFVLYLLNFLFFLLMRIK